MSSQFSSFQHVKSRICSKVVNAAPFANAAHLCFFYGRMTQDALHDVQRNISLHQPGCQRVAQGVGVHLFDLAALRYRLQPDLKSLRVKVGSFGGWKQQIVGIGPIAVGHGEDVAEQQLAEAV